MNKKKLLTSVALAGVVLAAALLLGRLILTEKNVSVLRDANRADSPASNQENKKTAEKKINFVLNRIIGGKEHVIFNGNDAGEISDSYPELSRGNVAFERNADASPSSENNSQTHIIYNGKDMGEGFGPMLFGNNIAFYRKIADNVHFIYNNRDAGEMYVGDDYNSQVTGDSFIFQKNTNGKSEIMFNGENLGKGMNPALSGSGKSFAFTRAVFGVDHIIYNKEDMGEGDLVGSIDDSYVCYENLPEEDSDAQGTVFRNKEKLGDGESIICSGENYLYQKAVGSEQHIIYNGKDMGATSADSGDMNLSGKNFVFVRGEDKNSRVIYNGKDMGEGRSPAIVGESLAYVSVINGSLHVIFNGKDMGEGDYPELTASGEDVYFIREISGRKHFILNDKDLGETDPENFYAKVEEE